MFRRLLAPTVAAVVVTVGLAGCATSAPGSSAGRSGAGATVAVAASINAWGSILAQLGGDRVAATSIISNPDTDPHVFEPTPADGRTIAGARVFVENGVGYDAWAQQAVAANPDPSRTVIDVGALTGTPDDGNPHQWYSPSDVSRVADAITAALTAADPANGGYFAAQRAAFEDTALAPYHQLITDIRARYAGTTVGASESIVAPLSDALGLDLLTPPSFLRDVSEGNDPSAADKATIDQQIAGRQTAVYVYNAQNSTPDVAAQVSAAQAAGIPVVQVTETLSPQGATFQDWQTSQLQSLKDALGRATGR